MLANVCAALGAAFVAALPALVLEPPTSPKPRLRWDEEVFCDQFAPNATGSGAVRIQCDPQKKECVVAPSRVLDAAGVETEDDLARLRPCQPHADLAAFLDQGYRLVPALAEVQPGWIRDERGRAMQYNFDLHRRAWLGALYAPITSQLDPSNHRLKGEMGLEADVLSDDAHTPWRWHLLETQIYLGAPTYDGTVARLDWSTARSHPLLFVTTFVGKPARHDVNLDVGGWFEGLHIEYLRRSGETESFLTIGSGAVTVDLWHSPDLSSYVRVRGGAGAEYDTERHDTWLKPLAAVEGDFTLDADGFHHVHFQAEGEKLYFGNPVLGRAANPERLRLQAGYEVIIVAINDQPLSLVLNAKGTYRDDFVSVGPGWELTGEVGLRFSLWAPARRSAPVEAKP